VVATEAARVSWRTLLVLVLVVAGLGWFALRTADVEKHALAEQDVALFPGLDENLVVALRIENVQRDLHMRFERDSRGGWLLTDPVAGRAESSPLDLILQAAMRARGAPVQGADFGELSKIGLDPPRFVLDIESGPEGARTRQRAEFGAVELDGARIFARADGRVVRLVRELEPLLDMQLHELRATSLSEVDPRTVLEFQRTGAIAAEGAGPGLDARIEAVQEGGRWSATAPVAGLLDAGAMALYVHSVVTYRYETVVDEGSRALGVLGLDPPELTLRFGTIGTEVVEVLLGRTGTRREGRWHGTRSGSSVVWSISPEDVKFLAIPLEDLLDHKLVRARRGAIQRVEIGSSLGEIQLVRGAKGWTCASARAGSTVFGPIEPAETRAVEDALGDLERYELTGFLRGATFEPGSAPVRWRVVAEDGDEAAGVFGGPYTDASGATDVFFQRAGETAVAHGDPGIVERLTRHPEHFLSLRLLETSEVDLSGITVRGAGGEAAFTRNAKGIWTRPGGQVEARELRDVIESLLFVRASARIPESARAPLAEPFEIELASGAARARYIVGITAPDAERRAEVEIDGRRGVLLDARLHEKLGALLSAR